MAIPDYQSIMLPLLEFAGDGQEHSLRETIEALADRFELTREERTQLLPSGQQATFDNRVGWARTYLKKAGLLRSTRRGYYEITDRGQQVLAEHPAEITAAYLRQFPAFVEFLTPKQAKDSEPDLPELDSARTPLDSDYFTEE